MDRLELQGLVETMVLLVARELLVPLVQLDQEEMLVHRDHRGLLDLQGMSVQ